MSKLLSIITVCSLIFLLSCSRQTVAVNSQDKAGGTMTGKRQKALAEEIVSVQNAFGEALVRASKTKGVSFPSDVDPLSGRLEKVSKELDTIGPLPSSLREIIGKAIDDKGKDILKRVRKNLSGPMQPEIQRNYEDAGDRYFRGWGEVCAKAGLDMEAKVGK
jgi:hypothetical protein